MDSDFDLDQYQNISLIQIDITIKILTIGLDPYQNPIWILIQIWGTRMDPDLDPDQYQNICLFRIDISIKIAAGP